MAYSVDFRKAAIEYIDKGHTAGELYEAFGIYPSRVRKWQKLLAETGSLEPTIQRNARKQDRHERIGIGTGKEAGRNA